MPPAGSLRSEAELGFPLWAADSGLTEVRGNCDRVSQKAGSAAGWGGGRGRGPARPPPRLQLTRCVHPRPGGGRTRLAGHPHGDAGPRAGSRGGGRRAGGRGLGPTAGCLNRAEAQSRVSARPSQGTEGGPRREGLGEPEAPGEGGTSARSPGSSRETPTPRWWPWDPGSPTALLPAPLAQWPQGGSCPPGEPPFAPCPARTGSAQAAPPPGKSRPSPFTPTAPHNVGDTFSSSRDPCPSSLTPTEAARLAQGDLGPMWRVQPGPGQTPAILPALHSVTVFSRAVLRWGPRPGHRAGRNSQRPPA